MSKEAVAEKLGWKNDNVLAGTKSPYAHLPMWLTTDGRRLTSLPDWPNSLDKQARDIWPRIGFENQQKIMIALDNALVQNEDIAQACWKVIEEVLL